jgi:hypothetical protein
MRGTPIRFLASAGAFGLVVAVAACGSTIRTVTVTVTKAAQSNASSQAPPPPTTATTTSTTSLLP